MDARPVTAVGIIGLAASVLAASPPAAARQSPATTGEPSQQRVVARVDINGNGKRDVVRFHKRSPKRLVVRVRTDRGRVRRRVVRTPYIRDGGWYGAARLDGRRGYELVLLTDTGAHSVSYTVLTWRRGHLKVEHSPAGGRWFTDWALRYGAGWRRRTNRRRVAMVSHVMHRSARRPVWRGKATRYVWRNGDWRERKTRRIRIRGDRKTAKRFGWRGTTLPQWPR